MLFEKFRPSRSAAHVAAAERSSPTARNQPSSQPLAYRDLVRVVLRDVLRQHGIPLDWIGCDVTPCSAEAQASAYQINFIVHMWHEGLLRYAPLLQQKIAQGLQEFEPQKNHRLNTMAWVISPQVNFPHENIPGPAYWRVSASAGTFRAPGAATEQAPHFNRDQVPTTPGKLN